MAAVAGDAGLSADAPDSLPDPEAQDAHLKTLRRPDRVGLPGLGPQVGDRPFPAVWRGKAETGREEVDLVVPRQSSIASFTTDDRQRQGRQRRLRGEEAVSGARQAP